MRSGQEWPAWLEALRPDDVTRRRLRAEIMARARSVLRPGQSDWLDVASRWATLLSPVAAAVTLLFAGLAVTRTPDERIAEAPPRLEELVETAPEDVLPATFMQDSVADLDVVFTAISSPR